MRVLLVALSALGITLARMPPWHAIALVLLVQLVPAAAALGQPCHAPAVAAKVPPAESLPQMPRQAPHRDATLPCCAGPLCTDLVPLAATAAAALPDAGLDVAYAPVAACAARGIDPGPPPPPPRPVA